MVDFQGLITLNFPGVNDSFTQLSPLPHTVRCRLCGWSCRLPHGSDWRKAPSEQSEKPKGYSPKIPKNPTKGQAIPFLEKKSHLFKYTLPEKKRTTSKFSHLKIDARETKASFLGFCQGKCALERQKSTFFSKNLYMVPPNGPTKLIPESFFFDYTDGLMTKSSPKNSQVSISSSLNINQPYRPAKKNSLEDKTASCLNRPCLCWELSLTSGTYLSVTYIHE